MGRKKNHKKSGGNPENILEQDEAGADLVPEPNETGAELVPESNEVGAEFVPESNEAVLESNGVGAEFVPEANEAVLEPNGVGAEFVSEPHGNISEPNEVVAESFLESNEVVVTRSNESEEPNEFADENLKGICSETDYLPEKLHEDIQEVRKYIDEKEQRHRSSKMLMCVIH